MNHEITTALALTDPSMPEKSCGCGPDCDCGPDCACGETGSCSPACTCGA